MKNEMKFHSTKNVRQNKTKGDDDKRKQDKIYITASELAETLGISKGHAYKIIKMLNDQIREQGYLVICGKIPRRLFEDKYYGLVRN